MLASLAKYRNWFSLSLFALLAWGTITAHILVSSRLFSDYPICTIIFQLRILHWSAHFM
jgi:hypothetical protein